jgi:hypothetical protein
MIALQASLGSLDYNVFSLNENTVYKIDSKDLSIDKTLVKFKKEKSWLYPQANYSKGYFYQANQEATEKKSNNDLYDDSISPYPLKGEDLKIIAESSICDYCNSSIYFSEFGFWYDDNMDSCLCNDCYCNFNKSEDLFSYTFYSKDDYCDLLLPKTK